MLNSQRELLRDRFGGQYLLSGGSANPNHLLRQKQRYYFRVLARYFPQTIDVPIGYYFAEQRGHYLKRKSKQIEIMNLGGGHISCLTSKMRFIADDLYNRLHFTGRLRKIRDLFR